MAGVPDVVTDAHSKRAAEITAEMERTGNTSYHARNIAARATRAHKRHQAVGELMPRWVTEIEAAGVQRGRHRRRCRHGGSQAPGALGGAQSPRHAAVVNGVLAPDGALAARSFTRRDVIVAVAPAL